MKKCVDCNVDMIEDAVIHTDYVGGVEFEEQIFVEYYDEENGFKPLLGKKKMSIRQAKARVCPKCGKVELYVDIKEQN